LFAFAIAPVAHAFDFQLGVDAGVSNLNAWLLDDGVDDVCPPIPPRTAKGCAATSSHDP
jgi:hypothetical protein